MSESDRIRAAAESASDTPAVAPDSSGDGGGGDGGSSPTVSGILPSFTKRQATLVVAGVLVGVLVLLWLRSRRADEQRAPTEESAREQAADEREESMTAIDLPSDPSDPLAADEAVTEALRQSGTISGGDDGDTEDEEGV